jgi:putative methyltransferase (TIGR04325 family)
MSYREIVKDVFPPFFLKKVRRHLQGGSHIYSSYSEALNQCRPGYAQEEIAKVVIAKNIRFSASLSRSTPVVDLGSMRELVAITLSAGSDSVNVLDFGGGGGHHYIVAKAVIGSKFNLRWNVVETETMVDASGQIADGKLRFFTNIEEAADDLQDVDLVFSSNALQYVPDQEYFLNKLLSIGATNVFLTRVPLSRIQTKVIVQHSLLSENGPGPLPDGVRDKRVSYPATFSKKDTFESILKNKYDIKAIFQEDQNAFIAQNEYVHMYGYLCSQY